MRIGRFGTEGSPRLGAVTAYMGTEHCVDLRKAAEALMPQEAAAFASMDAFIRAGPRALELGYRLLESAQRHGDRRWSDPVAAVRWLVPVGAPRNFLCAGRNFHSHHRESSEGWQKEGVRIDPATFPTGFVKLPGTMVGAGSTVDRPANVTELDYEVEIAAVIGKPIRNVSEEDALAAVFGYTVFIDLSAREWQRQEMRSQMILIGKNFPGFGPLGPWILTADEMPDPSRFTLELRVNGDLRQQAEARGMIFSLPQLVAFWSQVSLLPGDLIATGTPEGVAMHHKGPESWYLEPGDVIQASIDPIGRLEVKIG